MVRGPGYVDNVRIGPIEQGKNVVPTPTQLPLPTNTPEPTATERGAVTLPTIPTDLPDEQLVYVEDFEDGVLDGWFDIAGAEWLVQADGTSNQVLSVSPPLGQCAQGYFGSNDWENYVVQLRYYIVNETSLQFMVRTQDFGNNLYCHCVSLP